ncbi:hypothetical protein G6F43_007850 [Rhizopus delemar]|nr:hypothetical protein G6F43_007850 [Rhizopus delemar]
MVEKFSRDGRSAIQKSRMWPIIAEHEDYMERLIDQDSQVFANDIIEDLTKQFEDFSNSKSRLNSYLKSTMQITIKKRQFLAHNVCIKAETKYHFII